MDVSYTYTSITAQGDAFLDGWTEDAFMEGVVFWEQAMNHFLKTGLTLRRGAGRTPRVQEQ